MFKKDKVFAGVLIGLLFPFMFFVIFYELKDLLIQKRMLPEGSFRLQFLCIISVVANVIPAGSFVRNRMDKALKGIVTVTLLLVAAVILFFYKTLLSST